MTFSLWVQGICNQAITYFFIMLKNNEDLYKLLFFLMQDKSYGIIILLAYFYILRYICSLQDIALSNPCVYRIGHVLGNKTV